MNVNPQLLSPRRCWCCNRCAGVCVAVFNIKEIYKNNFTADEENENEFFTVKFELSTASRRVDVDDGLRALFALSRLNGVANEAFSLD